MLRLVLDGGERLPCLVHADNWHPARVATRWAVRYRRYHVQSSTLDSNLRAIGRLYTWALESLHVDLDDFLTSGERLNSRSIESFAAELRGNKDGSAADTGAFDQNLRVVEDFLRWSLDDTNRGGANPLTFAQLSAERSHLNEIFRALRVGGRPADRIQPLEEDQVRAIRRAIGPHASGPDGWTFPALFAPHAQLRNWLMFEVALQLGIRRGELLKLRLDSLPRGAGDGVLILRRPDDPHDSRAHEPAVKTAERAIPAVISNHAGAYVCNHVFYSARHALEQAGQSAPCGFIHLPALRQSPDSDIGLPLDTLVEAVNLCLDVVIRSLHSPH